MHIPVMKGVIRRRMLVNFRVDAEVIRDVLPAPFQPKLQRGQAIAGICLIRLEQVCPRPIPAMFGIASENAAHRIAVTWNEGDAQREGVFIPRRDTGSILNHLAGGRVFPGEHHRALFDIDESERRIALAMRSFDHEVDLEVRGVVARELPSTSVFASLSEASAFFEAGALGYSVTADPLRLHGVTLHTREWRVEPFAIEHVHSSYFANENLFPRGSVEFDCGLLMRNVEHAWEAAPDLLLRAG
ncbi:MAG TPA: DUF2071 domain-containing protein [Thermoanaerobaculia bacterium]|nr:DUF2071 domain-containing protein [Thermoanaerobaculia bacterium]